MVCTMPRPNCPQRDITRRRSDRYRFIPLCLGRVRDGRPPTRDQEAPSDQLSSPSRREAERLATLTQHPALHPDSVGTVRHASRHASARYTCSPDTPRSTTNSTSLPEGGAENQLHCRRSCLGSTGYSSSRAADKPRYAAAAGGSPESKPRMIQSVESAMTTGDATLRPTTRLTSLRTEVEASMSCCSIARRIFLNAFFWI